MSARRIVFWILGVLLLVCLLPVLGVAQDGKRDLATPTNIEQELLDILSEKGSADFIVNMAEQADLSAAYQMRDWNARGRYVYDTLRQVAARSQAQAKGMLSKQGQRFQTFIAGNELYVWAGDLATAKALARLPGVASIRATKTYHLDPIVGEELTPQSNPQAVTDWGIADTRADQFWSAFGIQGDGIIVANIDTGVQWDHPALVGQFKCPGDPSNPACWFDPSDICGGSMCDNMGHGSHTMGTMVADDDPSLPYIAGMAPNAQWIACKGCEYDWCSDYALNACADWILAPGGDPDNRPYVVNNSWGGGGCNTWYLPKVQAWRAAGTFPAFSAGNDWSCSSLGSPGDYQESFGSASHRSDRIISDFSSKGPSCFGDDPYTKPNISAPGENICSTVPGNSWDCYYSGTSMASPHSAGAVALLWACNPSLVGQIDQTFEILQDNADAPPPGDCGAPGDGEGNFTYGYGYLDVYQAGLMWCGETGTLEGHVTDAVTTTPIEGVLIEAARQGGGILTTSTDASGYYAMTAMVGTYDVTASQYGYVPQTTTGVEVVTDTVTTQDFVLVPAAFYTVDGTVTDSGAGWPLYARINIGGYPAGPIWTNPETGYYSVELAEGVPYQFEVHAWSPGYLAQSRGVGPLTGDQTEDFQLQADMDACTAPGYQWQVLYSQPFEAGNGGFTTYGYGWNPTSWQWGTPASGPGHAHSGTNVWATNLSGNYSDGEDSYVESPDIDMSPYAGQGLTLSWWQWLQTEGCCDFGEVQVSNDGGSSWTTIYGPAYGDVDLSWTQHNALLDSSYAVSNLRVRFHLWTDGSVTYPGYYVDDVAVFGNCLALSGGLVTGNVYDGNTSAPLVGAAVTNDSGGTATAVTTPDDPAVDDAFYGPLFSPAGDHVLTATMAGGYVPDVQVVTVVTSDTVQQDFYLPAGRLSFAPPSVEVTLDMGQSTTVPSTLSNDGGAPASFELKEQDRGFQPMLQGGQGRWLSRAAEGVPVATNRGTEEAVKPGVYRFEGNSPTQLNILVCSDSCANSPPNTCPERALQNQGQSYTLYFQDWTGCEMALGSGTYDLAIIDNSCLFTSESLYTTLDGFLTAGGKLIVNSFDMDAHAANPLWANAGVVYVSDVSASPPPPVYRWDPSHPAVANWPADPLQFDELYIDDGDKFDALPVAESLAGYTLATAAGEGALALRHDNQALVSGFCIDNLSWRDENFNGIPDCVDVWQPAIGWMLNPVSDVPWLSEAPITGTVATNTDQPIDVTFDASVPEVTQPGTYYATVGVQNDTPYGPLQVPVTMTVAAPPWYGKLDGTVTGLGYCDANPAPLKEAKVLVEGSTGMTWTLETDAAGYYQLWLDEANSPVTVTVIHPEHQTGQASGVIITGQMTTTVPFDLRWLKPCVGVMPGALSALLELGMSTVEPLAITNDGAAATTFELQEKERGFQPILASGPFAQPKVLVPADRVGAASADGLGLPPPPTGKILAAGTVIRSWPAASQPEAWGLACTADDTVWVGDGWGVNAIYEYHANGTPTGRSWPYPWGPYTGPADDAFNWNSGMVWTLDVGGDDCLHEMDPDSGYTGSTICGPWYYSQRGVAYDPATDTWYVGGWNEGIIYHIDSGGALLDSAYVGLGIAGLAYNPDTQHLFVIVNYDPNPVYVLDAAAGYGLIGQFYVSQGFGPWSGAGLEFDCDGKLWAVDQNSNTVYQFESGETASLCAADVPWLSESPITGTIPADSAQPADVTFDAGAVAQPGEYYATLKVKSDDPVNPRLDVPVTMTVTPPPTWGKLTGTVTGLGYCDAESYPLGGFPVVAQDGRTITVTTNVSGTYVVWLEQGTYTVTALAKGHVSASAEVTITAQQTTTLDLDLRRVEPCISLTPPSLEATLLPGTSAALTMTLINNGAGPSGFTVREVGQAGQLKTTWAPMQTPALGSAANSHEAGAFPVKPSAPTQLLGTGVLLIQDYWPWGLPSIENILANNGIPYSIINSNQIPWTDLTPYHMIIVPSVQGSGYNAMYNSNLAKFEDYIDGGGLLLLNYCDDEWNYPYRLPPFGGASNFQGEDYNYIVAPDHPIFTGVPNPYWGSWASHTYLSGLLPGDRVLVTGGNSPGGNVVMIERDHGAGMLVAGGQTFEYGWYYGQDNGVILNNMIPHYYFNWQPTPDIPWLAQEPVTGTVPADSTSDVQVTFTALPTLPLAIYTGTLQVKTDDAVASVLEVAVTMHVVITPGVEIGPDRVGVDLPGETVYYVLTVTNTGNYTDSFDLSMAGDPQWPTELLIDHIADLGVGESADTIIAVHIPPLAPMAASDVATIVAASASDPSVTDGATVTTEALLPGVQIAPPQSEGSGKAGGTVYYILTVTNMGNLADDFVLSVHAATWPTSLSIGTINDLAPGGTADVTVMVEVPGDATLAGSDMAAIVVASATAPAINDAAVLRTTVQVTYLYLPTVLKAYGGE